MPPLSGPLRGRLPTPGQLAVQAATAHAENRARVVRARERYGHVQALKAEGKSVATVVKVLRLAPGPPAAASSLTAGAYYRVVTPGRGARQVVSAALGI